ncbi:MAG: hypothetical protein WB557_22425, partial [Solirubrobacteraceae bacterium]
KREILTLGTDTDGWTFRKAERKLEDVLARIRAGVWEHPAPPDRDADELGCVRLGGGTCARLRFDPVALQARWAQIGGALPDQRHERRRSRPRREPAGHQHDEDLLLEFEREP